MGEGRAGERINKTMNKIYNVAGMLAVRGLAFLE